ncbi:hypothetical protein HID58_012881 [Brassica napus]|uniref:S1 motif domain-containing protein n=1 Tax=Brassica napus TaxID=3708 RepID=A0ABQ8E2C1_BRANA|nr:hypothetical protein HID58_012881 [Brassica napus]
MQAPAAQNGADQGLSLDGGRVRGEPGEAEEDRSKVDDLRGTPMSVGHLEELIDENHAIVSSSVGPEYYVGILSFVDKDQLEPGCSILMHTKVLSVVGILHDEVDPMVSVMKVEKAPLESYADIGGLEAQIQEIKEAVELPLTHPELYENIGIKPPKGVILYGEPGTGKTLLPKKYLRDGPKLVRELFRVADDLSPSIVFIDEIDAVGMMPNSGGEREIQRTMLELLNQLDGKIEFPLPDIKTRRRIIQIHTSKMTLSEDVNLEEFVMTKDEFSGADIKAICTEAGLRMKVTHPDFKKAKEKVMFKKKEGIPEGSSSSSSSTVCFIHFASAKAWLIPGATFSVKKNDFYIKLEKQDSLPVAATCQSRAKCLQLRTRSLFLVLPSPGKYEPSSQPFGAFVDFTDGLVHVPQFSDNFVKDVAIEQEVKVTFVEADVETKRISLTMHENNAPPPSERKRNASKGDGFSSKYAKGQMLDGTVKNLTRSGAFTDE